MNSMLNEVDICKHVLGLTLSNEYADIALQALEAGHDSPSLRILAGLPAVEAAEARALFDRCITEADLTKPTRLDALRRMAKTAAAQILNGVMTPYQGAKAIWNLSLLVDEKLPELGPFIYAASEMEDRPELYSIFESGVMAAARDLVSQ